MSHQQFKETVADQEQWQYEQIGVLKEVSEDFANHINQRINELLEKENAANK